MDTRPYFFWADGTGYFFNIFYLKLFPTSLVPRNENLTAYGTGGRSVAWDGNPWNDAFPRLIDANTWNVVKVEYPAALIPAFGPVGSVTQGINNAVAAINRTPPGTPFMLGGYSGGGVVMSYVLRELQSGSLTSRMGDFKGGVTFGCPTRQVNKLWPGARFSGSWDVPGSTSGSGGCFPASFRLTTTPDNWWDFSSSRNHPYDPFTATSPSGFGLEFSNILGDFIAGNALAVLASLIPGTPRADAVTALTQIGFEGHAHYWDESPPGYSESDPTSYQFALQYIDSVAAELSVAPNFLSPFGMVGWSPELIPPK